MSRLRVHCFSISLDGFGAGPNQDINNPLGVGGEDLHQWFISTRAFQKMQGKEEGTTGVDNDFAERGFERIGAWILGRDRKSTRLNSSHLGISYAVFCLKKKKKENSR